MSIGPTVAEESSEPSVEAPKSASETLGEMESEVVQDGQKVNTEWSVVQQAPARDSETATKVESAAKQMSEIDEQLNEVRLQAPETHPVPAS